MGTAVIVLAFASLLQAADPATEGVKAIEEKRYDAAVELLSKARESDPKEVANHYYLGFALSMLNRDAEAIASYRKALGLQPDLYEAKLNLGVLLLKTKQNDEALKVLESAVSAKPAEFRPNYYTGVAALASGDLAKAEALLRKASQLDPKSADAEAALGRLLARQDNLDEAAQHFRRAYELDSQSQGPMLELAELYERKGRKDDAIAIYKQFVEVPAVKERLGALLLETGKGSDAIPELEEAVKTSPTSANLYALGVAYLQAKDTAKAAKTFEQAVAKEPQNVELRMAYGRSLRDLRSFPAAAKEFFEVTKLQAANTEAWSELAGMLILMQRDQEALVALDKLRALGAEKPSHHFFRALVLDRNHQAETALASYQQFLTLSNGQFPDEEFKARQRVKVLKKELRK